MTNEDTNGIPEDEMDSEGTPEPIAFAPAIGPCKPCGGSGRFEWAPGVFMRECGMCAGTGMDYGVEIVAESVTFATQADTTAVKGGE